MQKTAAQLKSIKSQTYRQTAVTAILSRVRIKKNEVSCLKCCTKCIFNLCNALMSKLPRNFILKSAFSEFIYILIFYSTFYLIWNPDEFLKLLEYILYSIGYLLCFNGFLNIYPYIRGKRYGTHICKTENMISINEEYRFKFDLTRILIDYFVMKLYVHNYHVSKPKRQVTLL